MCKEGFRIIFIIRLLFCFSFADKATERERKNILKALHVGVPQIIWFVKTGLIILIKFSLETTK